MRCLLPALLLALLLAAPALAQPCVPALTGFPTGPQPVNTSFVTFVSDLMPYDDGSGPSIIVAGQFVIPPSNPNVPQSIARYQHGRWTPMTGGVLNGVIRAVAHIDLLPNGGPGPSIYATGDNSSVFRWTGTQWAIAATSINNVGYDLMAHADAAGPILLAASGGSAGVYGWRGTGGFLPYGNLSQLTGVVYRLRMIDDGTGPTLFAMGSFNDSVRGVRFLAKLINGQWEQYELPVELTTIQQISDIAVFDDGAGPELYVTGVFSSSQAAVYRKRAGQWQQVGAGLTVTSPGLGPTLGVLDEGEGPRLYLGGLINRVGTPAYNGLVRWDGTAWTAPVFFARPSSPNNGAVHVMQRFDEDGAGPAPERTLLGGAFNAIRTTPTSQQFVNAEGIVQFTGSPSNGAYEPLSRGVGGNPGTLPPSTRYTLEPLLDLPGGPRMLISGAFTRAGGLLAYGAATFDDANAGWLAHSSTVPGPVNPIIAATTFTINGERRIVGRTYSSTPGVVWWNGTQWVALPGLPAGGSSFAKLLTLQDELGESLYAVTEIGIQRFQNNTWLMRASYSGGSSAIKADLGQGERLLVGCNFQGPGVYAFDPMTAIPPNVLTRIGPLTPSPPMDIVIHNDGSGPAIHIVAGGLPGSVARLGAATWEPLGTGVQGSQVEIESFDDGDGSALYAAGTFMTAGGVPTPGFARWRAGAWSSVVPVFTSFSTFQFRPALAVFGNRLYIAGEFSSIGTANADRLAFIERCPPRTCTNDYDGDGDTATDADIEAFFLCLAGTCCPRCTADFNNDGDTATDADIESFFRVLAGGPC